MDAEQFYQSRVAPVDFFRAPSNIQESEEACQLCGQAILPGEQVLFAEGDLYAHRGCFEIKLEDQQEET